MLRKLLATGDKFVIQQYQSIELKAAFIYPLSWARINSKISKKSLLTPIFSLVFLFLFLSRILTMFSIPSNFRPSHLILFIILPFCLDIIYELNQGTWAQVKKSFAFCLHYLLPSRTSRRQKILAFFKAKKENLKLQKRLIRQANLDIKQFCASQFNITASGFINFYTKRAFIKDQPCVEFILYSLNIPFKDQLGPDRLRKILLSYTPVVELCPHITDCFKNYTLPQIEEIFTNHQGKSYFKKLIPELNEAPRTIPVYNSFLNLELFESRRQETIPEKLKQITAAPIKNFNFTILITEHDYEETGRDFSNCINQYSAILEAIIIRIKFDGRDYACVSIINNKIDEIKGINNRTIKNKNLIKIIKRFL